MEDCKYATDCTPNYFNPQPTPPERLLSGSMRTDNTAKDTRRSHAAQQPRVPASASLPLGICYAGPDSSRLWESCLK